MTEKYTLREQTQFEDGEGNPGNPALSQKIPIFIVSLARAKDRRTAMAQHLEVMGLNFEIMDAVDGKAMSKAERDTLMNHADLPLSPGDVGCYMSHINIYQQIVDRNIPLALVLEDDASLNPSFAPLLRDGVEDPDFDICFIDSWDVGKEGRIYYDPEDRLYLGAHFYAFRFAPPPHGTHAYLITNAAARSRLAVALPIVESIDWYRTMPPNTRFYGLIEPRGAWLNETYSTISFVSPKGTRNAQPWHMQWRRWATWYHFWNLVHPSMINARKNVAQLETQGILPPSRPWRPIPPTVPGGGPVVSPRPRQ